MKIILVGILSALAFNAYSSRPSEVNVGMNMIELEQLAESGNTDALVALGGKYSYGIDVKVDKSKGLEFYRQAAQGGNIKAMDNLGSHYLHGNDLHEAVSWYERALNQFLNQGEFVGYADDYYLRAILAMLLMLHETGHYSSELLLNEGLVLYRKVYESFDSEAGRDRVRLYRKAEEGDIKALLELASDRNSEPFIKHAEQRFLWMKAVDLGNVEAILKLAEALITARSFLLNSAYKFTLYHPGKAEDDMRALTRRAVRLYKKALRLGSVKAAEELAAHYRQENYIYIAERGARSQNLLLSRSFYQKAMELGSIRAIKELARAYEYGRLGVQANLEKAIKYYVMLLEVSSSVNDPEFYGYRGYVMSFLKYEARNGNAEANYQLGRIHREGIIEVIDSDRREELSIEYFQRAAKKGHTKAQIALQGEIESLAPAGASSCLSAMSAV